MKYDTPMSGFEIGDVVRVGRGHMDWIVVSKGATSGMVLENQLGRRRPAQAFDCTLIRRPSDVADAAQRAAEFLQAWTDALSDPDGDFRKSLRAFNEAMANWGAAMADYGKLMSGIVVQALADARGKADRDAG